MINSCSVCGKPCSRKRDTVCSAVCAILSVFPDVEIGENE